MEIFALIMGAGVMAMVFGLRSAPKPKRRPIRRKVPTTSKVYEKGEFFESCGHLYYNCYDRGVRRIK